MDKAMTSMSVWTVYEHPDDFPNCFVARRFELHAGVITPTNQLIVAHSLTVLRAHIEAHHDGLAVVPRMLDDDPHVVETWI